MITIDLALKFSELRPFVHDGLAVHGTTRAANNISILAIQNKIRLIRFTTDFAFFELCRRSNRVE